jgi:hypothetical protein
MSAFSWILPYVKNRQGIFKTAGQNQQEIRLSSILLFMGFQLFLLTIIFAAELPMGRLIDPRSADAALRPNIFDILSTNTVAYIPKRDHNRREGLPSYRSCTDPASRCTWEHTFGGALQDKAYGVVSLPDDGLIVVGNSRSKQGPEYSAWILRLGCGRDAWHRICRHDCHIVVRGR